MRICLLANAQAVHTRRWAEAYAERGHRVDVLSIRSARLRGATVHPVGGADGGAVRTLVAYSRLALVARRRLAALRPDVVQAHFTVTHGAIAAWAGVHPLAVTAWGSDVLAAHRGPVGWLRRRLNRLATGRADLTTATSQFLTERLSRLAPAGAAPVVHLPWGVDCRRFRPRERPAEHPGDARPVIGFVKTLAPKYGPQHLVAAMPRVLERLPGARLVLAGRGPMAGALAARARALGVEDRVELAGFVDPDDLPELFARFDLLVNPTVVEESFGIAPLEASACGLPVVATRVGGVPEVVVDGTTGLLVEPEDPAALARAIVQLGEDPELARRLGRAGRRFVEREYRWEVAVDRMLGELERLAAGGRR